MRSARRRVSQVLGRCWGLGQGVFRPAARLLRWEAALLSGAVALGLMGLIGLTGGSVAGAASDQGAPALSRLASDPSPGQEVVGERSRTSRTFSTQDGTLVKRLYPAAVNFRDSEGRWRPIDNAVHQRSDGSFENGANRFSAVLPKDLGDGVRLVHGGDSMRLTLQGTSSANTPQRADGGVKYPGALAQTAVR